MAKRSSARQSIHDQRVSQEARKLTKQGWMVKADLPGYERPVPIGKGKRVPDIEAIRRGRRKLLEVETRNTIGRDQKQHETFRRHAGQKPNTSFRIIVVDGN